MKKYFYIFTAIRVRFKGRAKVHWREGRYGNYSADETYFEMESDLLDGEYHKNTFINIEIFLLNKAKR